MERWNYRQSGTGIGHIVDVIRRIVPANLHRAAAIVLMITVLSCQVGRKSSLVCKLHILRGHNGRYMIEVYENGVMRTTCGAHSGKFSEQISLGQNVDSSKVILFSAIYGQSTSVLADDVLQQIKKRTAFFKREAIPHMTADWYTDSEQCVLLIDGEQWIFWIFDCHNSVRQLVYYLIEQAPVSKGLKQFVEDNKEGDSYFPYNSEEECLEIEGF